MEKGFHLKALVKRQDANPSVATELARALASSSTTATSRRRRRPTSTSSSRTRTRQRPSRSSSSRILAPTSAVLISTPTSESLEAAVESSSSSSTSEASTSSLPLSTATSSSSDASIQSAASSARGLQGTARTAVIAASASVAGALLLALLLYCFCRKRKSTESPEPSPLIGSFDDDAKSFVSYSQDYPAAVNHYSGRPESFLNNVHASLRSQDQLFRPATQPMSEVGTQRMTQDDPFKMGFGRGANTLTAALAGDLATTRSTVLQTQARQEELSDEAAHPYSEAAFSRTRSVRFKEEQHPYSSPSRVAQPDPHGGRYADSEDVDGPQGQQKWW